MSLRGGGPRWWVVSLGALLSCRTPQLTPAVPPPPPPCPQPLVSCPNSSSCVDLLDDPENCGACRHGCGPDETCVQGTCEPTCPPGFIACRADAGAACANLERDRDNCGGCGLSCAAWEICREGRCALTCAADQSICSGANGRFCADLRSDNLNCGECGRACGASETCHQGTCDDDCELAITFTQRDWVFPPTGLRPAYSYSAILTAGDFNGDGRLDIAADRWFGHVEILFGDGTGQLVPAGAAVMKDVAILSALEAFDVNRDGKVDLVALVRDRASASALIVLLGSEDGRFAPQPPFPLPSGVSRLTVGDLDDDGHADLVVLGASQSAFAGAVVVLAAADGSLRTTGQYSIGSVMADAAVADLTGDGIVDLALAQEKQIQILRGLGKGEFQVGDIAFAGWENLSCAAGDVNGDGRADLMVAGVQRPSGMPASAVLGILDGATGQAQEQATETSTSRGQLRARDVDSDGQLDLVLYASAIGGHELWVMTGRGDGNFTLGPKQELGASTLALADWNADGILDVALGGDVMSIRLGRPGAVFAPAANQLPGPPDGIAAVDMDGDGYADLVAHERSGYAFLRGRGDGSFDEAVSSASSSQLNRQQVIGDFDGDGIADACCAQNGTLFKGQGDGTFLPQGSLGSNHCTLQDVLARDLDRDGLLDLVTGSSSLGSSVCTMRGQAGMTFAEPQYFTGGAAASKVVVADIDGDQRDDFVTIIPTSESVAILYGNKAGAFESAIQYAVGPNPSALTLADWNADGRPDIVIADDLGLSTFRNEGNRELAPRLSMGSGDRAALLLAADLNDDGFDDVLSASSSLPGLVVLLSRGDGRFDGGNLGLSLGVRAAAIADFNDDGRPDLAISEGTSNPRVLLNQGGSCVR